MKKNVFKRVSALGLSMVMVTSLAACDKSAESPIDLTYGDPNDKPEVISLMADTIMTEENGLKDVCDEYYNQTGIKLEIEKPDHAKYYEKVTLSFASEEPADIIEMGSTYYPELANSGALWDMTEAWEKSTSNCKQIIDEDYVDALRINGVLYGFPMAAGNGTITYVRQDWLDEAGLDAPKNYDEFVEMLRAFKARGNGAIPITAAGLLNTETPYDIYLRESQGQTGIGHYVAIPHGKSDSVTQVGIAIGKVQDEIEWETLDGKGVKLIFLFAVGNDNENAKTHLRLLAEVARTLGNDDAVEALLNAGTVEDLKAVFA